MRKEEQMTVRRMVSRLSFIRQDLEAIGRVKIKSEKIRQVIKEMREKAEVLYKACIPIIKDL